MTLGRKFQSPLRKSTPILIDKLSTNSEYEVQCYQPTVGGLKWEKWICKKNIYRRSHAFVSFAAIPVRHTRNIFLSCAAYPSLPTMPGTD